MSAPVLWHIGMSHYSEKARWALDFKGVEHVRRTAPSGMHLGVALVKTGGRRVTFPLLELDGRAIADSTAVIAALEARYPEPPLYPADPADRSRALELEDWFDEHLGPDARTLAWTEITRDRALLNELAPELNPLLPLPPQVSGTLTTLFVKARYGTGAQAKLDAAQAGVLAALDRLEAELEGGDHLVGDTFTVADLTAAALLYPIILPPEGPQVVRRTPAGMRAFLDTIEGRPGIAWVRQTYQRHRAPAVATPS